MSVSSGRMSLCGTGWLSWSDLHSQLQGWQAVWTDLDGPHLGAPPDVAPLASHMWLWHQDNWCRIRIDESEAVAGFLHAPGSCPREMTDCPVVVVADPIQASSWAEAHIKVGDFRDQKWEIVDVVEGIAASFIRPVGSGVN